MTFKTIEPGFVAIGITFSGIFDELAIIEANGDPREELDRVREVMRQRQEMAFPTFTGVAELSGFMKRLDEAIDLERFRVTSVSNRRDLFQPVVDATPPEANAIRRFEVVRMENAGEVAPTQAVR